MFGKACRLDSSQGKEVDGGEGCILAGTARESSQSFYTPQGRKGALRLSWLF